MAAAVAMSELERRHDALKGEFSTTQGKLACTTEELASLKASLRKELSGHAEAKEQLATANDTLEKLKGDRTASPCSLQPPV